MWKKDRILWFASAKAKDLGVVLKNEGIKGISKMKKAEKGENEELEYQIKIATMKLNALGIPVEELHG